MARAWVEAGDLAPALGALQRLLVNSDAVLAFRGRLHLFVDGYDEDERELWAIPEVRTYIRALDAQFPYWLWFMDPHDPTVFLFVACCCEVASYRTEAGRFNAAFYPAFLAPFLTSHIQAVDELVRRSAFPKQTFARFLSAVMDRFGVPRDLSGGYAPFH